MDQRDQILSTLRMRGPSLPVQIVKAVGGNTILVGAVLSELSQAKKVKISKAKIGSSPVYFLPGQEARIGPLLYSHLHDKEKEAFDALKQRSILRDHDLTPVMRVALREIKDFSVPMEVTLNNNRETFWKWHLVSDENATDLIKKHLGLDKPKEKPEVVEEKPIVKEEKIEKPKPEVKKIKPEIKETPIVTEEKIEKPKPVVKETKPKVKKPKPIKEKQKTIPDKEKVEVAKPKETKPFIDTTSEDRLITKVKRYFNDNNIKIKEINVMRKNSEIDFIIELPSNVGMLTYYCKKEK